MRARRELDISSLIVLRVSLGAVLAGSVLRFVAKGWIARFFVDPVFHFSYPGFGFVRPLPGTGMYWVYGALFACALGIAAGWRYRLCASGFFLGFAFVQLSERTLYLNHYYLVSLLVGLCALLPLQSAWSVDVWRECRARKACVRRTLPAWVFWVLRLQVGIVYVSAGIAKLNRDWLLEAQPLRMWLPAMGGDGVLGALLRLPEVAYVASWAAAVFDLLIVGLLLWPRARRAAWTALVAFHALTACLFPIGMFPWIMLAAASVFLDPRGTRRLFEQLQRWISRRAPYFVAGGAPPPSVSPRPWAASRGLVLVLLLHSSVQLALPLARHADTLASAWTGRGFNFAWNVMLVEKSGHVAFRVRDRLSGDVTRLEPRQFLAPFQEQALAQDPELIHQAVASIAARYRAEGMDVAVYADAVVSFNGRPSRALIDPAVDLMGPLPETWILAQSQSPSPL